MTLDRYKFLSSLLVLREGFTVEDVVRFTELPRPTVATFLNRESRYVDRAGSIRTGRRGGQIAQYNVRADQFETLEAEVDQVHSSKFASTQESNSNLAATLIVADDLIGRLKEAKGEAERSKLVELTRYLLKTVESDFAALPTGQPGGLRDKYAAIIDRLSVVAPKVGVEKRSPRTSENAVRARPDATNVLLARDRSAPMLGVE